MFSAAGFWSRLSRYRRGSTATLLVAAATHEVFEKQVIHEVEGPKPEAGPEIGNHVPVTYVPFRNAHFLSIAVSWAEVLGADSIYIGAV